MYKSFIIFLLLFASLTAFAQKPKTVKKMPLDPAQNSAETTNNEKEEFDKAAAVADPSERIKSLDKFIASYPKSAEKINAQELIIVSRAQLGDAKLKNNEAEAGVNFFKLAVKDAPQPVSDKLFNEILVQIPSNLFFRGQSQAAFEAARTIESKISGNPNQLLGLATFYLGIENGAEAARLADLAITLDPRLSAAYQTLGIANRLDFRLDESAAAYQKAAELDESSAAAKRSLAEMKRAVGKPDEAVALYRELLAKTPTDAAAQTGLTLALFDDEKQPEAEAEMQKALAQNANNLPLLVGAAYWYAAHGNGSKAVELAGRAAAFEPRFVWARIALARGYMQQKRPLDAERELLAARQYGNFPTLTYELAAARLQAGFFREAAEALKTDFTVKDDVLTVKLGGRVEKSAKNFIELLTPERRAAIFEPLAADSPENAERLKSLLALTQAIDAPAADDRAISQAADAFIGGGDQMTLHRQLFVARQLLEKRKNIPKAAEIAQSAVGRSDAALDVPNASAAVLADALYDLRYAAALKNSVVVVPEIPRPTLSAILRGEIEEMLGWTAYQQNSPNDAVIHLKRAVSVLPVNSSFWRSSLWRLGSAYQAQGDDKQALESYLKSYPNDASSAAKYVIIEALYKKLNDGKTDGLEAQIGKKPELIVAVNEKFKAAETPAQDVAAPNGAEQPAANDANAADNPPKPATDIQSSPKPVEDTNIKSDDKTIEPAKTEEKPPVVSTYKTGNQAADQTPVKPEPVLPAPFIAVNNAEKPSVIISNTGAETPSKPHPKPLFEPIIIQVPSISKPAPEAEKPTPESTVEPAKNQPAPPVSDDFSRSRVIITNNFPDAPQCSISISQENVALNNGGSIGLVVGFEDQTKASEIKAVSSSPNDVDAALDEGIGGLSGRSFFLIKSISTNAGEYKILFEAPCGKKEISVKVR